MESPQVLKGRIMNRKRNGRTMVKNKLERLTTG
jgi:hypothetical protein